MANDMDVSQEQAVQSSLRVVGIAASAGGLEAVSLLVQTLPEKANAVYILAQHMSPKHKSVLASLISRETTLPVVDLVDEVFPEPDTIYVTPPNKDVIYEAGRLRLREPSGQHASPKPSGDRLFKSLAQEVGERSVGIVLSGTGSDGSYGIQAIQEAGGITITQDLASAKYDGMPSSAIGTGCVDLTLRPEMIGRHLTKILAQPRDWTALRPAEGERGRLLDLFSILRARTNVDFSDYKENTLNRRIARRMGALGIQDYEEYVDFCRTNEGEVEALHRSLLISVTRFFRDYDQFEKLRSELKTKLAEGPDMPVRVWVVGCATGEEAYSIAILIFDLLGGLEQRRKRSIQIFATDIDQNAIEIARRGVYPLSAAQDIPSEFLQEYFVVGENDITVRPELRAVTLFSRHNVFQDPPFINLDLVSIRNVLIYFNLALQERVLSRLHYSLAQNGLLFLGTSETVGELSMFFERRQDSDKIHVKRRGSVSSFTADNQDRMFGIRSLAPGQDKPRGPEDNRSLYAEGSLIRAVAEVGVVCTRDGRIVEFIGDTTPFVQIQSGAAQAPSLKMLVDPLQSEAQSLVTVALRNKKRADGRWHSLTMPTTNRAQLQVFPFTPTRGGELQFLLAINTRHEEPSEITSEDLAGTAHKEYVKRMEAEVRSTQEALQHTIEELQTANEELQSANEELLSTNEEFQATNEELETSNEELQSTNEELLTVNEELQVTSTERQALASELEAILLSSPDPVAFADQALMVRRASKAAMELFGIPDMPPSGVHISQAHLPQEFPALAPLASDVLRLLETKVMSIRSEGLLQRLTVSPVTDSHGKPIGVSLAISQRDPDAMETILDLMSHAGDVGYWTYQPHDRSLHWSRKLFDIYKRDPSHGNPTFEDAKAMVHPNDREMVTADFERAMKTGEPVTNIRRIMRADGTTSLARESAMPVLDDQGRVYFVIGVIWDLSEKSATDMLLSHYDAVHEDLNIGFYSIDVVNDTATWNHKLYDILGYDESYSPTLESELNMIHPEERDEVARLMARAISKGAPYQYTARLLRADGSEILCEGRGQVHKRANGEITHVFGSFQAIGS